MIVDPLLNRVYYINRRRMNYIVISINSFHKPLPPKSFYIRRINYFSLNYINLYEKKIKSKLTVKLKDFNTLVSPTPPNKHIFYNRKKIKVDGR